MKEAAAALRENDDGGNGVDVIVDLMDAEHGLSSNKQDVSAERKFNAFLKRHIGRNGSLTKLNSAEVTTDLIGKFTAYLLHDKEIKWQTSMNYLSSVKRQLEVNTGTRLFKEEKDWYLYTHTVNAR